MPVLPPMAFRLVFAVVLAAVVGCSKAPPGADFNTGSASANATSANSTEAQGLTEHSPGPTSDPTTAMDATQDMATSATAASSDTSDSQSSDTLTTGSTATTGDEAGSSSGITGAGTPLDPAVDVPDAGNEPCDDPGNLVECPGIAVCRFFTAEEGRCESCDVCGNLNAFCVEGTDCDILFTCFQGRCTNFCTLGSFECGPADACLDIGHATDGVCDPFA